MHAWRFWPTPEAAALRERRALARRRMLARSRGVGIDR
jgi:hypothetical protein